MPKQKQGERAKSGEGSVVNTQYGQVNRTALISLRDRYVTSHLLKVIDELDALVSDLKGEDGLREDLLRLHGMAHVVINDNAWGPKPGDDTLPELAWDVGIVIRESIETLQKWLKVVEPLESLQPAV